MKKEHDTQKQPPQQKSETALREEEVMAYWRERGIFEKTLTKPSPKGEFVFYDGPPFATGLPHYGSLLSSVIKDVVPRYKTMQGYHVRRRWGWDCHGLPIENAVEKQLGLKSKKEIFDIGIDVFNDVCRANVMRYARDWELYVDRIGRWVDFKGAYKTMDNTFIESVWWGLSEMYKKGLVYEGRKVLLYCPRCETPIAKAEVAQDNSYKEVTEESVYVAFLVKQNEKSIKLNLPAHTSILAWTTTPWTLPGNVALAVGGDIEYVVVEHESKHLLVARGLQEKVLPHTTVIQTVKGKHLVGLSYEPLYEIPAVVEQHKPHAHTVVSADFVTTEDGTGVVHTAVMYGEDDYELGQKEDLPMVPLLAPNGHFNDAAPELVRNQYFKKAEKIIKEDLENRGLLCKREMYTHSYPHCHRCDTAVIYNALTSWFINIQKIKKQLIKTNEDINWVPAHLKHGRYLNILKGAPDWTISRNRFWASPLPMWKHAKTGAVTLIGSLDELKAHTKKSGNTYVLMRHAEAESNLKQVISSDKNARDPLTDLGRTQAEKAVDSLPDHIDYIIHSGFPRTKETAEIIAKARTVTEHAVLEDARIGELQMPGSYEGLSWDTYNDNYPTWEDRYEKVIPGLENRRDVQKRTGEFLYDLEKTYQGKTILVVSHAGTLFALECAAAGLTPTEAKSHRDTQNYFKNAEVRTLPFVPVPHNRVFELDLHRPFIDEIELVADDGAPLVRIPEVIDCWVESGSMPFAEHHYPFGTKEDFTNAFPADFIAEYIPQTRTWFYYMHAVAVALFGIPSFKNVVTTGTVLAEDGNKMSKSKGNYTDPFTNLNTYGADALRYYLMSGPVMAAEDLRFSDVELREMHNRVVNLLWNTYKFYELFKHHWHQGVEPKESPHVLDQWMLSRVAEFVAESTAGYEAYDAPRAMRPLRDFVDDLSTWYVRRSRDRVKGENESDRRYALATLRFVLGELAKVIAPVMPFIAESIYRGIEGDEESVHMEEWPLAEKPNREILATMRTTREVVSSALKQRADAGIKVRQPLSCLTIPETLSVYEELVMDEVNVQSVTRGAVPEGEQVILDTVITPALQELGDVRDITRHIQQLRKDAGFSQTDVVTLSVATDEAGKTLIQTHEASIKRAAGVTMITYVVGGEGSTLETVTAPFTFAVSLDV